MSGLLERRRLQGRLRSSDDVRTTLRAVEQPVHVPERDRLGTAVRAELLEEPLGMRADRLGADEEPAGDLRLAQAAGEELQDLELPSGELDGAVAKGHRPMQVPA